MESSRSPTKSSKETGSYNCGNSLCVSNNENDEAKSASISTARKIFYKQAYHSNSSSARSTPQLRSQKHHARDLCPIASEEQVHLLGDSSLTVVELRASPHSVVSTESRVEENDDNSSSTTTSSNGAINDKSLPTCVSNQEERFGEDDDSEKYIDSKFKRSSILTKGESGSTVNEAIRDDDFKGDKTTKEEKEVPSFQANDDSKTLATLSFANSASAQLRFSSPAQTGAEMKLPVDQSEVRRKKDQNENVGFVGGHYSHQFFAAFAANFGAIALGAALSWTSPALPDLRSRRTIGEISVAEETWISAIVLLGAASACPVVGLSIERFGRKRCLLFLTAPFLVGWMLITLAQNIWMIYVGRFLTGFCGGGSSIAVPVYVTESASANIRGMLTAGFDVGITVGILYIFVVGTFVSWEWQAVACGLLPLVFHFLLLCAPESPRYLLEQRKHSEASRALQWLRGASSSQQVEIELQELTASVIESKAKPSSWRYLLEKSSLKPTLLALMLMVFQQLAAIDAVCFYTVDIFASSGADINENLSANIVGAIQVLATITAAIVVDRGGRRVLLLVSEIFMVLSLGTMGLFFYLKKENGGEVPENLGWLPLVSLIVYTVSFSVGMGPLPWLLMGELLPPHIKGLASGIVTITRWILGFVVTFLFQFFIITIGPHGCYWIFCGCCVFGTIFVFFFIPETKGKSMDEIQKLFADDAVPNTNSPTAGDKA